MSPLPASWWWVLYQLADGQSSASQLMFSPLQGWEFALSLFCSLFFLSKSHILLSDCDRFAIVAHYKKEQPWANCFHLITKERLWGVAQVAHDKRATISKSLSLLGKKEQHERLFRDSHKSLSKKTNVIEKFRFFGCFWQFFTVFPFFMSKSYLLFRSQKMSDLLEKPLSKFPTLVLCQLVDGQSFTS